MILLIAWVLLLAFVFAKVEVQIEGPHGWAAQLPTWRIEKHPLLNVFWGGRPLTGYHAWVFLFMALLFHLPLVLDGPFTLAREARILGSLALFWIAEDFLWFVINPAYGLRRFRKGQIEWHRHWLGPVPVDYAVYLVVGAGLLAWSYGG
jgi:hypothetical protein